MEMSPKWLAIALVWLAAYAVEAVWTVRVQPDVDPSVAVKQLHSNEAVEELRHAERHPSSTPGSVYAVAAIVTTGICLDSVMARLGRPNHRPAQSIDGSAELEERQER